MEIGLGDALAMIDEARIVDAKTIMLLQYAALKGLCVKRP
jgi:ADP-ribose pyrophosphatase